MGRFSHNISLSKSFDHKVDTTPNKPEMENWDQEDESWKAFGVKTREDYARLMIIKGHFHKDVPAEIKEAYQTVEAQMESAWRHYPMYDEALKNLLGILEMAVKKRCLQLGIELKKVNGKNKYLWELIKDVVAKEPIKNQRTKLDAARELRNYFAHPKDHSFAGGMFQPKVVSLVNTINRLFLPEEQVKAAQDQLAFQQEKAAVFKEGVLVLAYQGNRYLIYNAKPLEVCKVGEEWISFWVFYPILLDAYEKFSRHSYSPPITVILEAVELGVSTLSATVRNSEESIIVSKTTHAVDIEKYEVYQQELVQLSQKDHSMYQSFQQMELAKKVEAFVYEYSWSETEY